MFLMIVLGLITTLLGVAFGCTVLELTVRAVRHSLTAQESKAFLRAKSDTRWGDGQHGDWRPFETLR